MLVSFGCLEANRSMQFNVGKSDNISDNFGELGLREIRLVHKWGPYQLNDFK